MWLIRLHVHGENGRGYSVSIICILSFNHSTPEKHKFNIFWLYFSYCKFVYFLFVDKKICTIDIQICNSQSKTEISVNYHRDMETILLPQRPV